MEGIIIGMDLSAEAGAALRWAVREAEWRASTPTAVLAWGLFDQHNADPDAPFNPSYGNTEALDALNVAIKRAVGTQAAPLVRRRVVCDLPARALVQAAYGADLLAVGARGLGGFRSLLVGSVSDQCLRHANSPVAIVRPTPATTTNGAGGAAPTRIVVGVDGSDNARLALRWALDEGRARGAPVQVVHAWQPGAVALSPFVAPVTKANAAGQAAAALLDATLDDEDTTGLPEPVIRTPVCSRPAPAILQAADDADLVVVGSRGLGGFRGLLLGSVGYQVAHHAPCPVVVVPPPGPRP